MHMLRIGINAVKSRKFIVDNTCDIFFDSVPVVFGYNWYPVFSSQDKMIIQIVIFYFHIEKVIR